MNVAGKAQNFLAEGPRQSVTALLRGANDAQTHEVTSGPLLPCLKEAKWSGKEQTACRPLLDKVEGVPLLTYGHDQPHTFAFTPRDGADLEALHKEAIANLANIKVNVQELDLSTTKMIAVDGGYFVTEKILDVAFMKTLHARLKTSLLAVSIPKKGRMLAVDALKDAGLISRFLVVAEKQYSDPTGDGNPITPMVFLVQDGVLVGVARHQNETDVEVPSLKKKGFFSRLFS
jgi:hypothetical protein